MIQTRPFQIRLLGMAAFVGVGLFDASAAAHACDEFVSRLVDKAIQPSIKSLDCGLLGKAGFDIGNHQLKTVCYTSAGATSNIEIVVDLECKTSDKAFFKGKVAETVTATAEVRASDCELLNVNVSAAGEIGKLLIQAFDVNGRARGALIDALSRLC